MAGAYWHFYTANLALEKLEYKLKGNDKYKCILEYREHYLAGVQGPDFNFYPNGNIRVSQLAHGRQPADLGRSLLRYARSNQERAFAYGWLMHLTTDNITHPLVNKLILKHFPSKTINGTNPGKYPLGHHRVEWGIDVNLLQNDVIRPYLPELKDALIPAKDLSDLVNKTLNDLFAFELNSSDWNNAVDSMVNYLHLFDKVWAATGRITDKNPLKQAVKGLGYNAFVKPIAKLIGMRNPDSGAGVFIPIKPVEEDINAVFQYAGMVCPVFAEYLEEDFINLPNDTG